MGRPLNAPSPLPSLDVLNMLLEYEESTGKLFWKDRAPSSFSQKGKFSPEGMRAHWQSRFAGNVAGHFHSGYLRLMINGVHYMCHRLVWKIKTGEEPVQIDHIDGNRSNNRFSNLRDVSHQVNAKNRRLYENNKTGVPGVSYHERDGTWQVRIGVGEGNELHLGNYSEKREAISVRIAAQTILDYHANHGKNLNKD